MKRAFVIATGLGLLVTPAAGDPPSPCDRCKPATAAWDWKANGYAVGPDANAALETAKGEAIASGCKTSAKYLVNRKLKCKFGCRAGELADACEPSEEPKCTKGRYQDDRSMWMFVCRKYRSGKPDAPQCDDATAQLSPGYGMCDVHVRATKTLDCAAPDCGD